MKKQIKNALRWRIFTALKDWAESHHYRYLTGFAIRIRG